MTRDLTDGERRVFQAYVDEETHELAAQKLGISVQTLKNHLGSIYKKVDARKAHSALYRLALQRGIDPLAPLNGSQPPNADNSHVDSHTNVPAGRIIAAQEAEAELNQEGNHE